MFKLRLLCKLLLCIFSLLYFGHARGQDRTVTGTVADEKGNPLAGATVKVKGSSGGANTDGQGKFNLTVPGSAVELEVSFVGYATQAVRIGSVIRVVLQPTRSALDEVVVVGYGTQKRKDVTGSVASVKGVAIKDLPVTSITAALQGRAAGVEVIDNSGQPGGSTPEIIIRGVSSLHQPAPLYIVDGVRVPGDNINIQDIATVDILKDASAAAIYGSAAAGGVILITTKKGAGGKPAVNFNMRYGVSQPKLVDNLLNRDQWIQLQNVINPNYFKGATQTDTLANTDWVHALYGNAYEQNYNLSVSGSTPAVNYLASGFYNAQKGIFIRNYSNIGGARVNTDFKLGDFVKIGEQIAFSQRKTQPLVGDEAQLHNAPFRTAPVIPIKNRDGSWGTVPPGYGIQFGAPNPVGAAYSADAIDLQNNFQGNVYGEVRLPLHLTFRSTLGYSYYLETMDYYQYPYNFGAVSNPTNALNKLYNQSSQLLDNFVLTYDQEFGKHSINAVAGYEQITTKIDNLSATVSYNGLPDYSIVTTSQSSTTASGEYDGNGLIKSYFGRLNYNFDKRYYLSGSIRQDANYTVFGPNKQKGIFGAGSVGWNISDERFFTSLLPVVNSLKLRGSYGTLGNSNIPPYNYAAFYGAYSGVAGFGNTSVNGVNFAPGAPLYIGSSINTVPNADLHWETVKETNIGIDGELLSGKIYFSAEWYKKMTQDMLYALPLPPNSGYSAPYFTNIGNVLGKGVDLLLGYRDKAGDLSYDVSVNAGFNTNKVTNLDGIATDALYDGYNYYNNGNTGYGVMANKTITITKTGLPFGSFYGYKATGMFQTDAQAAASAQPSAHAGDLIFAHDPKNGNVLSTKDQQVIGNPNPKLVYGLNVRLNYKGFDLAMLFKGVAGVQLFNGVKAYEQFPFVSDATVTTAAFHDSYFGSNGLTSQPRMGVSNTNGTFSFDPNGNYTNPNSYFVENGSYVKLKNVQLGYTFSDGLMQRMKIRGCRVFVMANNLFTLTKYSGIDPEVGSSYSQASLSGYVGTSVGVTTRGLDAVSQYPQARIYSAGIDINFQ